MFLLRNTFNASQIFFVLFMSEFVLGKPEPFSGFYQSLDNNPTALTKSESINRINRVFKIVTMVNGMCNGLVKSTPEKTVEMPSKINDFDDMESTKPQRFPKWSKLSGLFQLF